MLTGERRALAAASLAFYGFLFLIVSLQPPMPGWGITFGALAAVYGLGFFGLVAGYFWARWYAIGLGMSGAISAAVSMWQLGLEPVLMFYGGTHLMVSLFLWGGAMSSAFDGKKEWRDRFHLDESATHRLGKAVIRVGVSLPYVIMYALAPKEDMSSMLLACLGGGVVALGAYGLFRMRSWGVVALFGGLAAVLGSLAVATPGFAAFTPSYAVNVGLIGAAATGLLALAVAPFVGPMTSYLLRRS